MRKKLLSGLFWVLLLNLLIKPFWIFGIDVGVQNAVGVESYGFYFAIFNLAYIFNILLDFGVTNYNTRNISQHPQLIGKHLSGILCIKLLLLGLFLIVTFSVGLLLGYSSRQFYLLLWLCINQFLNSLIIYLRSNYEGLLMFKADSVLSILDRVLMIAICGVLLWVPGAAPHGGFQIEWFVYAQTAAYVVTAAVALMVLVRKTGIRRLHWSAPFTLAILKQSAPFALLVLLMASYNRIDPVLIERMLPDRVGSYQSGIYAGAFRMLDALTMIAYLVSVPLLPIYSRLTAAKARNEDSLNELRHITQMICSLMMVFAIGGAVTCASLGNELMGILYPSHAAESVPVFRTLIFGLIPISLTYIFGTLLTANGSLKQLNILATITLLVNVGVNLLLIPQLGAQGSAWASLTAQSFIGLAQMVLALHMFHMKPSARYLMQIALFTLIMVAANILVVRYCSLEWWIQGVLSIALALAAAMILKLIDIKEIIQIFTSQRTANTPL